MQELQTESSRKLVLTGVGGMLALALGAAVISSTAAASDTDAVMLPTTQSTVTDAVAAAAAAAAVEAARVAALQAQIEAVGSLAHEQVGDSYRMGAWGPDAFDCSGFTMWVYQNTLGVSLPHNTHAQWNAIPDTWHAGEKDPQQGDLVFFFDGADHVGVYVGDGMMVHAENSGTGVVVSPIYEGYWADNLTGFGRIIR